MQAEFSPQYAYVASDSMDLVVKIAKYVGRQYDILLDSLRQSALE